MARCVRAGSAAKWAFLADLYWYAWDGGTAYEQPTHPLLDFHWAVTIAVLDGRRH
jgi:hypothetical protein